MPFTKGDPNINRQGRPSKSRIDELAKAIDKESERQGKDFWEEVAKKAFTSERIMLAVVKKFIPDLHYSEVQTKDKAQQIFQIVRYGSKDPAEGQKDKIQGDPAEEEKTEIEKGSKAIQTNC